MTLKALEDSRNLSTEDAIRIVNESPTPTEPARTEESIELQPDTEGATMIDTHPKIYAASAIISMSVGSISVLNSLVKSWYQAPTPFDWFSLVMGSVMCGLPLFRHFAIKPGSVEGDMHLLKPINDK